MSSEVLTPYELVELFYLSIEFMRDEETSVSSGIMKINVIRRCKHKTCTYEVKDQLLDNKVHYAHAGDLIKLITRGVLPLDYGRNKKLFYSPCPYSPYHT